MLDLAVLTGFKDVKSLSRTSLHDYYLQQLGIDIWKLRDNKVFKAPVIVVETIGGNANLTKMEQKLLSNMLESTSLLSLKNLHIIRGVDESESLINSFLLRASVFIVMGYDLWQWIKQRSVLGVDDIYYFQEIPVFTLHHPADLLKNTNKKKLAYLEFLQLEKFINDRI